MSVSVIGLLKDIKSCIGDKKAYLYGTTIRKILNNEVPDVFNIFIKVHHAESRDKLMQKLPQNSKIYYTLGTSLNITDIFTINLLYVDLESIIDGNIEVQCFQQGLKDYNKKSIRFTKEAINNIKPEYILRAIELSVDTDFHLDSKTITEICNNKTKLDNLQRRTFYRFLADSLKHKKTRKLISLCNTLGISKQILGFDLVESSILNHMKSTDVLEFMAVIFSDIPSSHLADILVNSCGFFERDVPHVVNLSKALEKIEGEDEESAREFLKIIEKRRISNVIRLLKLLDFKDLAKNIKKQKEAKVTREDLCVDAELLKAAFGIVDETQVTQLLEKALEKVISEPEYNDKTKILRYLNNERGNIIHG